jgi:predicted ribosome quality control (RQC) complex YloA/Tae2 family protein
VRQITKTLEQFELRWIVTEEGHTITGKNEKEEEENM